MKQGTRTSALLVFVRTPRPGKVKTRLARSLGNEKAAEFYKLCTDAVLEEIGHLSRDVERYISFAEPISKYEAKRLAGLGLRVVVQEGESLGQRLYNAFSRVLENGTRKVVIVASDVPDLTADIMKEAFSSLDKSDVVIGPCYDGGYYLIGMKELHDELFNGISWGTELVFRQTLNIARENGLTVRQVPILVDIDTEADLRQWSQLDGHKKPALMDFIQAIRL
jgi:rSAM/selenodomain-associated transferase 1